MIWNIFKDSRKFTLVFILNFAIGISGILFLEYFKDLMNGSLESQAKSLLGSDLEITSRFPITLEQVEEIEGLIPEFQKKFEGASMSTMASSSTRGRLVQVIQIAEDFPYFGGFELDDGSQHPGSDTFIDQNTIWVYPELLAQLDAEVGDLIKVGNSEFEIKGMVSKDSLKAIRFTGFVPRIYMTKKAIERAELVQLGSTVRYSLNFQFKGAPSNKDLEDIERDVEKVLGAAVSVRSPWDASDRVARMTQTIADFLSLISLICLFLCLVSLFYLYSGFLLKYKKDFETLLKLGVRQAVLVRTLVFHFFAMVMSAAGFIYVLSLLFSPWAQEVILESTQTEKLYEFDSYFFLQVAVFLVLLTPSVVIPLYRQVTSRNSIGKLRAFAAYLPMIAILFMLSAFVTEPANIGLYFSASVLGLTGVSSLLVFVILKKSDSIGLHGDIVSALANKSLIRNIHFSLPVGVALFLSLTLFSLGPLLGFSLQDTISLEKESKPKFFLFDIQDEQIEPLQLFLGERGIALQNLSPMVRARVVSHNGEDFKTTVPGESEEDSNQDLKNRVVNLSYRADLYESERITDGRPFSTQPNRDMKEVSVETRYAARRGIDVGDTMTFDVLGLEIKTVVVNLRSVKWTDFVPNFFILFEDGVLNEAPKTHLATVPPFDQDSNQLILDLNDRFSNISVVNVEETITDILKLIEEITGILTMASVFCLILGLIMIFVIIQHQMNLRTNDILRLKIIGVTIAQIKKSVMLEFTKLSLISVSLGLGVSTLASWLAAKFIFQGQWVFQGWIVGILFPLTLSLVLGVVYAILSKNVRARESLLFE